MAPEFLDLAVKLAAAGMSGVCIFMALWSGVLVSRLPNNASREKYRTIRQFMWTCVALALIAGGSGVANAYFSRGKIVAAETKAEVAQKDAEQAREAVTVAKDQFTAVSRLIEQNRLKQAQEAALAARNRIELTPPDELFKHLKTLPPK